MIRCGYLITRVIIRCYLVARVVRVCYFIASVTIRCCLITCVVLLLCFFFLSHLLYGYAYVRPTADHILVRGGISEPRLSRTPSQGWVWCDTTALHPARRSIQDGKTYCCGVHMSMIYDCAAVNRHLSCVCTERNMSAFHT